MKFDSKLIRVSSVGLELGISVIIGLIIGDYLDGLFGTKPWLLLVFLIIGLITGFRSVLRLLKKVNSDNYSSSNKSDNE